MCVASADLSLSLSLSLSVCLALSFARSLARSHLSNDSWCALDMGNFPLDLQHRIRMRECTAVCIYTTQFSSWISLVRIRMRECNAVCIYTTHTHTHTHTHTLAHARPPILRI